MGVPLSALMAPGPEIPDSDHVSRLCGASCVGRGGQPNGTAFRRKIKRGVLEPYASVNWLEYLQQPDRTAEIQAVRSALLGKGMTLQPTGVLAVVNVGTAREHVSTATNGGFQISFHHEWEQLDPSHSGIYGIPVDEAMVADLIAEVVEDVHPAKP